MEKASKLKPLSPEQVQFVCQIVRGMFNEDDRHHGYAMNAYELREPEYIAFTDAQQRCTNPKDSHYKNYGERGIQFRFKSFKHSLDVYTQAVTPAKREAQSKVVEMIRPVVPRCSHAVSC